MTRNRIVLIVDDSEVTRAALSARLTEGGVSVVCASSAEDALALDATGISAAIVDVELGDDDGLSLADVLLDRNPRLRLALFSGHHQAQDARKVFRKPEEVDQVVAWALKD